MSFNYPDLIQKKTCNALIKNAKPDFTTTYLVAAAAGAFQVVAVAAVIDGFNKALGGLWVGGNVYLTKTKIAFYPNKLNAVFHNKDIGLEIPLADLINVKTEFGFISGKIALITNSGTLRIRVFDATGFAGNINNQISEISNK